MTKQWFDVDKNGLGKQAEEHGKGRLIGELVQNALDEAGVTRIDITLEPVRGRPLVELTVEDDSPEGFRDLTDAYTLFAPSYKRGNPEQRGQFNFGEKLVLSICESAAISTTKGTVLFEPEEGRIAKPRQRRKRGSVFNGIAKMTRDEYAEVCAYLRSLLLPEEVVVTLNGKRLKCRKPLHTFDASLNTMVADEEGVMRPRVRKTKVSVCEALPDEEPSLYEMGLPVVETGDKWHVNIGQKLPLNRDRNNVKPSFLRKVRTLVLNEMNDRLTKEDANEGWVRQASDHPACSEKAITRVLDLRFGKKRAAYDMSDLEANNKWVSKGGTIVHGGMMSKGEWTNAKEAGAIQPAGQLCPTPKPYSDDPDAEPETVVPEDEWTEGMKNIVDYAKFLAKELMDVALNVRVVYAGNNFTACYGSRRLTFNLTVLDPEWFDHGVNEEVDRLLIHEFGHQYCSSHLSDDYYTALCRLGARLKRVALEEPESLREFTTAAAKVTEHLEEQVAAMCA